MDASTLSQLVPPIALAIALAACTGLRAWLPLLLAGLLARGGWLPLSPSFRFLAEDRALVLFGVATLIELLADKIPAVDHALDLVSTVLRPAAGTLLAASALTPVSDPLTALVLGALLGVPSSLAPHAAKSALRATSSTLTAGLANPLISLLEDVITVGLFALAVLVPVLMALLTLLVAVLILRFLRAGRRAAPRPA